MVEGWRATNSSIKSQAPRSFGFDYKQSCCVSPILGCGKLWNILLFLPSWCSVMWTLEIPTKNDTDVSVGRQQMEQTKKGINIIEMEPPVNSQARLSCSTYFSQNGGRHWLGSDTINPSQLIDIQYWQVAAWNVWTLNNPPSSPLSLWTKLSWTFTDIARQPGLARDLTGENCPRVYWNIFSLQLQFTQKLSSPSWLRGRPTFLYRDSSYCSQLVVLTMLCGVWCGVLG